MTRLHLYIFAVMFLGLNALAQNAADYRVIQPEQTKKLKDVRDEIGSIDDLDKIYEDHEHKNGMLYHTYVPKELEAGQKYPVVIFLHGYTDLTLDTHKGFPKGVWTLPRVQKKHPHIVFLPRNRVKTERWTDADYRARVITAFDDFAKELKAKPDAPAIDLDRVYITGFSRGGQGTWNYIRSYPDKFAAAAPLSGFFHGPKTGEEAADIKHIPIWIFNGDGDKGVKGSRESFKALKAAGAKDLQYHEYKKQGHVIDDFAYFTEGFFDWMFARKRSVNKK